MSDLYEITMSALAREIALSREQLLERARRRGGTASMIISSVCNEHKNSDLRANDPAIMRAFNERFEFLESQRYDLLAALKHCVDGLGSQPGYVSTLALSYAVTAIAKAEGRS